MWWYPAVVSDIPLVVGALLCHRTGIIVESFKNFARQRDSEIFLEVKLCVLDCRWCSKATDLCAHRTRRTVSI